MAMENGGLSASDVALMTNRGYDGFDGGWGGMIWLFAILALMGGGFGGWGNNGFANAIGFENLATQSQVDRGFDNQNSMANQREILSAVTNGTAQAVAATNQTFHDTLTVLNDKYSELQRDIAANAVTLANLQGHQNECCCNVLRAIDGVNFNNAQNTAAINANTTAQTQKILDAIAQDKIDALQNKVNQLELAQATNNVLRYPNSWTYNAGMSPFCGCGCGNM